MRHKFQNYILVHIIIFMILALISIISNSVFDQEKSYIDYIDIFFGTAGFFVLLRCLYLFYRDFLLCCRIFSIFFIIYFLFQLAFTGFYYSLPIAGLFLVSFILGSTYEKLLHRKLVIFFVVSGYLLVVLLQKTYLLPTNPGEIFDHIANFFVTVYLTSSSIYGIFLCTAQERSIIHVHLDSRDKED